MPFDAENLKPKIVQQGGHARTLNEVLIQNLNFCMK